MAEDEEDGLFEIVEVGQTEYMVDRESGIVFTLGDENGDPEEIGSWDAVQRTVVFYDSGALNAAAGAPPLSAPPAVVEHQQEGHADLAAVSEQPARDVGSPTARASRTDSFAGFPEDSEELISIFCSATDASEEEAKTVLVKAGWDLDEASN
eukprot:SAG31_NODE_21165_length_556_cov_1.015317_1_plen_151_part_10